MKYVTITGRLTITEKRLTGEASTVVSGAHLLTTLLVTLPRRCWTVILRLAVTVTVKVFRHYRIVKILVFKVGTPTGTVLYT